MTALHWAIEKRFPKLVTLLLKHGADPTVMSKFDKSPITLSLETKQDDVFQELISNNTVTISEQEQVRATVPLPTSIQLKAVSSRLLSKSFVQEEATASLMYEMEKDNYESIDQTDIEQGEVLDSPQNSPQPAKPSHVAKVLLNNQKNHTSKSKKC